MDCSEAFSQTSFDNCVKICNHLPKQGNGQCHQPRKFFPAPFQFRLLALGYGFLAPETSLVCFQSSNKWTPALFSLHVRFLGLRVAFCVSSLWFRMSVMHPFSLLSRVPFYEQATICVPILFLDIWVAPNLALAFLNDAVNNPMQTFCVYGCVFQYIAPIFVHFAPANHRNGEFLSCMVKTCSTLSETAEKFATGRLHAQVNSASHFLGVLCIFRTPVLCQIHTSLRTFCSLWLACSLYLCPLVNVTLKFH